MAYLCCIGKLGTDTPRFILALHICASGVGKFLSADPLEKDYPQLTPYQFSSNSPIVATDIDGEEAIVNVYLKVTTIIHPLHGKPYVQSVSPNTLTHSFNPGNRGGTGPLGLGVLNIYQTQTVNVYEKEKEVNNKGTGISKVKDLVPEEGPVVTLYGVFHKQLPTAKSMVTDAEAAQTFLKCSGVIVQGIGYVSIFVQPELAPALIEGGAYLSTAANAINITTEYAKGNTHNANVKLGVFITSQAISSFVPGILTSNVPEASKPIAEAVVSNILDKAVSEPVGDAVTEHLTSSSQAATSKKSTETTPAKAKKRSGS